MASARTSDYQFFRRHDIDDVLLLKTVGKQYERSYSDKRGNSIDPRLAMVLDYFQELYFRKQDLFRKIFLGIRDEFSEILKKLGVVISNHVKNWDDKHHEAKAMRRSLSLASRRSRSIGGGELPLRLERFKVRTVDKDGSGGEWGGQGGAVTK